MALILTGKTLYEIWSQDGNCDSWDDIKDMHEMWNQCAKRLTEMGKDLAIDKK